MGGVVVLSQPAKSPTKVKDFIIDVLSTEYPLTARKIYNTIIRKHPVSIAYQNVHKFSRELVRQGVLKEIDKEYLINIDWLDQAREFCENIKRVYLNRPAINESREGQTAASQNTYGIIQLYKKMLVKSLEPEVSNKPFLNALPVALTDSNVRVAAGKEANISAIPEKGHALLLGESGSGKTTALKMMALQQAKQGSLIPIFFKLSNYQGEDLLQIACKQIKLFTRQNADEEVIKSLLYDGSFMFVFDGLNEASKEIRIKDTKYDGQELLLNNVKKLASDERFSKNKVIISCRAYNDPKEKLPFPAFKLQPLSEPMVEALLSQKNAYQLFKQMKRHRKLFSFCQNPLMLSMLLKVFESRQLATIKRSELYWHFLNEFLYGWEGKTIKARKEIVVNDMIKLLSRLAYEMTPSGTRMEYSKAHNIMEKEAKCLGLTKRYLNELIYYLLQTNLLKMEGLDCEFMHQSIQEYLAAFRLKESMAKLTKEELEQKLLSKDWHETFTFYAALDENESVIQQTYELFERTQNHWLLFLAAKCAREKGTISDALFDRIMDSLFMIYNYPEGQFYPYWYELNNLFQSWQSRRVTNRIISFFNECGDEISPRVVNVLHHSSLELNSQHKGVRKLQEIVTKKSGNRHLLYSAIEILALNRDMAIVPSLIRFLSDEDSILKAQSCWALKEIGEDALDKVRCSKKIRDPLKYLANIQQGTFNPLVKMLDKRQEDFVRGHAMIELSKMDYKRAVPYILECLKEDKAIIKYHASYMIPNIDDEDASFLLNFIQTKEVVPEEYNKIVSSIAKKPVEVPQNGGEKLGI